jgi:Flp pilus assembly protein CpaB
MSDTSPATPRCACPFRNPIMLLMILLAVATTGCRRQAPAPEPVETVEVLVAAKDLPVGTMILKHELSHFVARKTVPKDSLPPQFITDEADLVGQRLKRPVLKDQTFSPDVLSKGNLLIHPGGPDIVTLPISLGNGTGFVVPGSRVDILAGCRRGEKLEVFVLLEDMHVLAVATEPHNFDRCGPDCPTLSFAANQEQALLLTLAKQRGCVLEVLLRAPGKPTTMTGEDYKQRRRFLEELLDEGKTPVAPAPLVQGSGVQLPEIAGKVAVAAPIREVATGFVLPGSRVDILAGHQRGDKREVFVLLEDVLVLAVENRVAGDPKRDAIPGTHSLSLAVDREQALLLSLAKQRGCDLEVQLRAPGKPLKLTKDDYKNRVKYFEELSGERKQVVEPAPRPKGE